MASELEKDVEPEVLRSQFRKAKARLTHSEASDYYPPAPWTFWQKCYLSIRRGAELLCTVLLLVFTGPLIVAAALAVKLTSRGPAFYTQVRIGRGGKPFTILKLRSMIHQCESLTGPRWCIPGDPRITPFGYFLRCSHIDELPQLINVLLGQMSLIGPRPERPEFVVQLDKAIPGYRWREKIAPGITGLAQVQLPPETEVDAVRAKVAYDLYYLRCLGFWLDVKILGATLTRLLGFTFALSRRIWGLPTATRIAKTVERPLGDDSRDWDSRQAA